MDFVIWIMHQQLRGHKVEGKLHLGVREQKKKKVEYHRFMGRNVWINALGIRM
jgi:hypothetical protein